MKRFFAVRALSAAILFSSLLVSAGCESSHQAQAAAPLSTHLAPAAGEITLEQLARLLPRHAISVGFDVDDTLIFSAPAFNALEPQYDPHVIRPKNYADLTLAEQAKYHEFWNRLNTQFDDESSPKQIAGRLLALHMARGDDIWIISKRQSIDPPPADGDDVVTHRYERMFGVHFKHPVVQTELQDKAPFISAHHIDYYYGDSDSDIVSATAAGAVPIRVKRAAGSYAKDVVHNGQMGEAVLADSDR